MYKGNNRSLIKQAARAGSHHEFCTICGAVVMTRGGVCSGCAEKAERRMHCMREHGIVTRIIQGQPACVQNGVVVHQGKGCFGCKFKLNVHRY